MSTYLEANGVLPIEHPSTNALKIAFGEMRDLMRGMVDVLERWGWPLERQQTVHQVVYNQYRGCR
jgi:hypothetical protein